MAALARGGRAGNAVGRGGRAAAGADAARELASTPGSRPRQPRSLMQHAVTALARREYSRAELRSKLLLRLSESEGAEAVDTVLDQLSAKGMLSDQRFAASRVRARAQRYGAERIRQELRQYGLADDVMREALSSLPVSEFDRAREVWQRKFGTPPADANERARQMRFLSARGFAADTIVRVLRVIGQV